MTSFLKRLALASAAFFIQPRGYDDFVMALSGLRDDAPRFASRGPAHRSRHTVAQDQRRAAKIRAKARAKKHGQA